MNDRHTAPTKTTRLQDPVPFRVWTESPLTESDPKPWKCLGAWHYLQDALTFIDRCHAAGLAVVFQSPAYTAAKPVPAAPAAA